MNLELLQNLYGYTNWANRRVLQAAANLADDDYRKTVSASWGSVHGTLAHMLGAEEIWLSRWQGNSPDSLPGEADFDGLDEIDRQWEVLMAERQSYLEAISPDQLAAIVEYTTTSGEAYAEPLWQLMMHVANHATDHRSHVSIMMTEFGHPPPQLDMNAFFRS